MQASAEINWEPESASGALRLSGVVDIFEAERLRDTAREAVRVLRASPDAAGNSAPVHLNLTGVERLDVSAVQLLCAFRQALAEGGRTLRVEAMPASVALSLRTLGVTL